MPNTQELLLLLILINILPAGYNRRSEPWFGISRGGVARACLALSLTLVLVCFAASWLTG